MKLDILIMSPGEYQLACHMNEPKEKDLGNFVLSPMPGTLISFAVKVRYHENIPRAMAGPVMWALTEILCLS